MEGSGSNFQVFINHRGLDTKNTLASLLYEDLLRLGVRVFLDKKELTTGNTFPPEIDAAIRSSSVYIAIFSPEYAGSTWCLEELCLMMQQRQQQGTGITLISVFCDVKPSDLRRVNQEPYTEFFTKHKARGWKEEDVERWEKALIEAAGITGHEFDREKDMWGEFVAKIVDVVLEKVRREPLRVADHPVGLDKAAHNFNNEILEKLETSADTTIVGIAGLGGTGKTALATHLYNLKPTKFSRFSFCKLSRGDVTSLQKQLLADLVGDRQWPVWSTKDGERLLRQRLSGLSRVFIVLDDIENEEQIDPLLPALMDVLGKGSLIVITSSDKDLLTRYQVKWYNMKLLDEKDAGVLFCRHAFHMSEAPTRFADMAGELVKMCGGYPLALIILGARLFGMRLDYWKQKLKNLQKNKFPIQIVQKIKAAYNSLEEEAQAAFLHVASFFHDQDVQLVVRVHPEAECPLLYWIGILGQKCLVEFQWVEMSVHDQMTKIKYNDGVHEDFCIEYWIRGSCVRRECRHEDCKIGMHKFVRDISKQIASEERHLCESSTEIQNKHQFSVWAHQLPQETVARGSLRRLVVVDDCIQEFQQLNFLKCFLKRLRKCEASQWPSGMEGGLYPLSGVLESALAQ